MIYLLFIPLFFVVTLSIVELIMYKRGDSDLYLIGTWKDETMTNRDKIRATFIGLLFSPFMIIYLLTLKN